jgi:hypothetical protein
MAASVVTPPWPLRDRPEPPEPLPGDTVGNRPVGLVGVVYAPSGSEPPGSENPGRPGSDADPRPDSADDDDDVAAAAVIVTAASAWYDFASSAAFATAVRVTLVPEAAAAVVAAPATSSELCPVTRVCRLQTSPLDDGHTANVGASTSAVFPTLTVTVVSELSAAVVHTKIAKLAVPPGAMLLLRYGKTDTQSWAAGLGGAELLGGGVLLVGGGVLLGGGVVLLGGGVVSLGLGSGLVSLGVALGSEPEDEAGCEVGVLAGVGLPGGVVLGLADGVAVAAGLDVPVVALDEAGPLGVADLLGVLLIDVELDVESGDPASSTTLAATVGRVAHTFVELSRTPRPGLAAAVPTPKVAAANITSMPRLTT